MYSDIRISRPTRQGRAQCRFRAQSSLRQNPFLSAFDSVRSATGLIRSNRPVVGRKLRRCSKHDHLNFSILYYYYFSGPRLDAEPFDFFLCSGSTYYCLKISRASFIVKARVLFEIRFFFLTIYFISYYYVFSVIVKHCFIRKLIIRFIRLYSRRCTQLGEFSRRVLTEFLFSI